MMICLNALSLSMMKKSKDRSLLEMSLAVTLRMATTVITLCLSGYKWSKIFTDSRSLW